MIVYIEAKENEPGKLPDEDEIIYMFIKLTSTSQILAAGLVLVNILQVYNWFTRKHICTMLALYFLA